MIIEQTKVLTNQFAVSLNSGGCKIFSKNPKLVLIVSNFLLGFELFEFVLDAQVFVIRSRLTVAANCFILAFHNDKTKYHSSYVKA